MAPAAAPAGSLEERISTLLSPFRKIFTAANAELAALEEKKVTVLSRMYLQLTVSHPQTNNTHREHRLPHVQPRYQTGL
jgi:hypothetical protein